MRGPYEPAEHDVLLGENPLDVHRPRPNIDLNSETYEQMLEALRPH